MFKFKRKEFQHQQRENNFVKKHRRNEREIMAIRVAVSTKKESEQRVRIGVLLVGDQDQVLISAYSPKIYCVRTQKVMCHEVV